MKKLIILLTVAFFLLSCVRETHNTIPEDMKPLLVNNDTICFLDSVKNRIDTFCVTLSDDYTVSNGNTYDENIHINYKIINKRASFYSIAILQWSNSMLNVSVTDFRKRIFFSTDQNDSIKTNINIHGIIYPTVRVFSDRNLSDSIPSTIYYSLQHGIIRYDNLKGRQYKIINK